MLNHIVIMGRLTADPEKRMTSAGKPVTNFTIACDRDRAAEGKEKETDFIDCVAFSGTADFIPKYFSKGDMIAITGRLQIRNWTDKEGNKRRSAEVSVANTYFCGGKKSDGSSSPAPTYNGGFPETEAYLKQWQDKQVYSAPSGQSDFAMLEDDDPVLPF